MWQTFVNMHCNLRHLPRLCQAHSQPLSSCVQHDLWWSEELADLYAAKPAGTGSLHSSPTVDCVPPDSARSCCSDHTRQWCCLCYCYCNCSSILNSKHGRS
jgi:hypothetical protein